MFVFVLYSSVCWIINYNFSFYGLNLRLFLKFYASLLLIATIIKTKHQIKINTAMKVVYLLCRTFKYNADHAIHNWSTPSEYTENQRSCRNKRNTFTFVLMLFLFVASNTLSRCARFYFVNTFFLSFSLRCAYTAEHFAGHWFEVLFHCDRDRISVSVSIDR